MLYRNIPTTAEHKLTWCALHIRSMSCLWRNLATTSAPKVKDTPRSFSPHPITSLSGSAQSRSHSSPWSGTSVGRMTRRTCSIDCRSGERPGAENNSLCFSALLGSNLKMICQAASRHWSHETAQEMALNLLTEYYVIMTKSFISMKWWERSM